MSRSSVSRVELERNLAAKLSMRSFAEDLRPLLAPGIRYDVAEAGERIKAELLALM